MLSTFAKFVQYLPFFFYFKCVLYLPLFVCLQCKFKLQVQSNHIKILEKKKARIKLAYLKEKRKKERKRTAHQLNKKYCS